VVGRPVRPGRLHQTIDQIMADQETPTDGLLGEIARAKIAEANRKMARYKAAIDAGADLAEVAGWITEAKAQRLAAEAELRQATSTNRLTREQVTALITEAGEITATLHSADPGAMADAYRKLGIRLTYDPGRSTPATRQHRQIAGVRGGIDPIPTYCSISYGAEIDL
jgi:site-specific DNA recombinase